MTAYDEMELRAPGTDDEPWTVSRLPFVYGHESWCDGKHTPGECADPTADRRPFALAVLIVALAVVAIVWWPR